MKVNHKITIALGISGVLAATAYVLHANRYFTAKPKPQLEQVDAKSRAEYEFFVQTMMQEQNSPEREILSFKGVLVQSEQGPGEYQTEWSRVDFIKVNGADVAADMVALLVNVPTLSKKEGKNYIHYLPEEFPETFAAMQNSFLYKAFPSMDLQGASPQMQMESDEFGNVNVSYEITPSGDLNHVNRLYLQSVSSDTRYDADKNSVKYTFAGDILKSANGEVAVYLSSGTILTTRLSIQMKGAPLAKQKVGKLVASDMRLAPMRRPGAQLVGGTTIEGLKPLDEVFAQLDSLKDDEPRSEYNQMLKNVVYDLYYNPGNLPKVVDKIKSIKERDDDGNLRLTMLMAAVAGTETKSGAEALAQLAKTGCEDDYCRHQAAAAAIMHNHPSVESATTFLEVAQTTPSEDVSGAAFLAAGAAGSKLGSEFTQLPSALSEALSKYPEETNMHRSVILAMGNHGDAAYFSPLRDSLRSKDGDVRGAAALALRNLPNAEVNSLLKETFAEDDDRAVVLDAVRAMHARNFEGSEYVEIASVGLKANQEVQEATANMLLEQMMYNGPHAADAVNLLREKTKFPDVKSLIDETLARHEADLNPDSQPDEPEEEEEAASDTGEQE